MNLPEEKRQEIVNRLDGIELAVSGIKRNLGIVNPHMPGPICGAQMQYPPTTGAYFVCTRLHGHDGNTHCSTSPDGNYTFIWPKY